jgi:hypothetical protein
MLKFFRTDSTTGRRRKVKCRPSKGDSTRCIACVARNSTCIEKGRAIPVRKAPRRKELYQRIAILENLVHTRNDSSEEGADENDTSSTPRRRPSETHSLDEFLCRELKKKAEYPSKFEHSLFSNGFNRISATFGIGNPAIRTTLFPIGGFKHERDCKILLAVLKCAPNIEEALEQQNHHWARKMNAAEPTSSSTRETLSQYARQALAGDNPVKIARIVQAVASVTLDVGLHEKLVLMVDRLIVSDDEYLSTLEGMECTLEQGRLLTEMGQVRRSW